eukprot:7389108-Prymnesium_polylepis.2
MHGAPLALRSLAPPRPLSPGAKHACRAHASRAHTRQLSAARPTLQPGAAASDCHCDHGLRFRYEGHCATTRGDG